MRNPNYDFGNIIKDTDELDNLLLFDDKELFMHIKQRNNFLEHDSDLAQSEYFHILVREWHPETWQLGPITEV